MGSTRKIVAQRHLQMAFIGQKFRRFTLFRHIDWILVIPLAVSDSDLLQYGQIRNLPLHRVLPGCRSRHDLGQAGTDLDQIQGNPTLRVVNVVVPSCIEENPFVELIGPDFGHLVTVGVHSGNIAPARWIAQRQTSGNQGEIAIQAMSIAATAASGRL